MIILCCISTGSSVTCDFEDPYLCGYYSTDANTEMEGKHVIYQDWIYDHTYGNISGEFVMNSKMTSFFRFVNKRAIYQLGIISLTHAPVHVTAFPIINVHVDELLSARIWQHKLCATLSVNIIITYRLPIKVYYCICTLRHIWLGIKY